MSKISVRNSTSPSPAIDFPNLLNSSRYNLVVNSLCREHYLRNNKRGGLKNLRCFPECLPSGHHSKGFCGHRVAVTCNTERPLPNGSILVGSFVTWKKNMMVTNEDVFKIGDEMKIAELAENTRTRDDPLKDYVASEKFEGGKNPNTSTYKTIFHFSPTSWHYGWRSSKHKKDQRHCFRVVLLLPKKALKKATQSNHIGNGSISNDPMTVTKKTDDIMMDKSSISKDANDADDEGIVDRNNNPMMIRACDTMVCVAVSQTSSFTLSSSKRARAGQLPIQQHLTVTPGKCAELQNSKETKKRKKIQKSVIKRKLAKQVGLSSISMLNQTNGDGISGEDPKIKRIKLQIAIDSLLNRGSTYITKILSNNQQSGTSKTKEKNKNKRPAKNKKSNSKSPRKKQKKREKKGKNTTSNNGLSFDHGSSSVIMPHASLLQNTSAAREARYERSDSMLTLPSDSEHDDDIYVEDQDPNVLHNRYLSKYQLTENKMFHPSAQKGTKILLKKSSITSDMQSNNSANDIGMPRISSTSSNLSGLGGSSNNLLSLESAFIASPMLMPSSDINLEDGNKMPQIGMSLSPQFEASEMPIFDTSIQSTNHAGPPDSLSIGESKSSSSTSMKNGRSLFDGKASPTPSDLTENKMFHPSAQKGTKILLKKSSITSDMQSNNSNNDIGMPRNQ